MRTRDGVLGHIVLNVANLKKSENFYRSIVGMKISARNRRTKMTFMSFGREHHDVALMELPKGAKHMGGEGIAKLHHFCIYVGTNEEVDELLSHAQAAKNSGRERTGDLGSCRQPLDQLSRSRRQPSRDRLQRK